MKAPGRRHPSASGYRHLPPFAEEPGWARPSRCRSLYHRPPPPPCSPSSPARQSCARACSGRQRGPLRHRRFARRRCRPRSRSSRRSSRSTAGCVPPSHTYDECSCEGRVEPRRAGEEARAAELQHRLEPVRAYGQSALPPVSCAPPYSFLSRRFLMRSSRLRTRLTLRSLSVDHAARVSAGHAP